MKVKNKAKYYSNMLSHMSNKQVETSQINTKLQKVLVLILKSCWNKSITLDLKNIKVNSSNGTKFWPNYHF